MTLHPIGGGEQVLENERAELYPAPMTTVGWLAHSHEAWRPGLKGLNEADLDVLGLIASY